MAKPTEVWKFIPEIGGVVFASNLGHLMQVTAAPDSERGGEIRILMADISRHLMLDPRTDKLGWAFTRPEDGSVNFVSRDSIVERFEGIPVEIDRSHDESARKWLVDTGGR